MVTITPDANANLEAQVSPPVITAREEVPEVSDRRGRIPGVPTPGVPRKSLFQIRSSSLTEMTGFGRENRLIA